MGDEERDGHMEAHHLLHKCRQVGKLVVVCVGGCHQGASPEDGVELVPDARLHLGVVH